MDRTSDRREKRRKNVSSSLPHRPRKLIPVIRLFSRRAYTQSPDARVLFKYTVAHGSNKTYTSRVNLRTNLCNLVVTLARNANGKMFAEAFRTERDIELGDGPSVFQFRFSLISRTNIRYAGRDESRANRTPDPKYALKNGPERAER